jgi:hypothetical protein
MSTIHVVELQTEEQALYDSICWDAGGLSRKEYTDRMTILGNLKKLAESLMSREAIPKSRLDFIGGHGKSRMQVFESNGTSEGEILSHPHFIDYLWYFINGPKLPKATIEDFCKIIDDDMGTSGMLLDQIRAFVRKEVRKRNLSHKAPDEFMKLALEIGREDLAESVRSAAKSVKK